MISAGIFAVALASAIVPPVLDAEPPVPAPIITFAAGNRVVTATVQLDGRDIATDDLVTVEMRQYSAEQAEGVLIGRVTATGDSAGRVLVSEAMALDRGARYMSVLVTVGERSAESCTPAGASGTGCTVRLGAAARCRRGAVRAGGVDRRAARGDRDGADREPDARAVDLADRGAVAVDLADAGHLDLAGLGLGVASA